MGAEGGLLPHLFIILINTLSCLSCSELCSVRLSSREGIQSKGGWLKAWSHHKPGCSTLVWEKFQTFVEYLLLLVPNICTSETTVATYLHAFHIWFKNKCMFWWETAVDAKCNIILQFQTWENHFQLFLPRGYPCSSEASRALLVQAATSHPSKTFHICLLWHLLHQEVQHIWHHRTQTISLHGLLSLTQDFASTSSQSAGKHQAGIRKCPFVPLTVQEQHTVLSFHKESPKCKLCVGGRQGQTFRVYQEYPQIYELFPCLDFRSKSW